MMDKLYFKDVPQGGDLYLEQVLFTFEGIPIVFVCLDNTNNRYLCICDDIIESYSWIVIRISKDELLRVLNNEISVLKAFEESEDLIVIVEYDKNVNEYTYQSCDFKEIDELELPSSDEYLDSYDQYREYILKL